MVLYNRQSSVVPGAEGKWDGADITVLAPTKAKVTSCLKIREKPSLTATATPFRQPRPDDPGLEEKGCIPPGTEITVLARSTKKQKVQKWQNYWYVIEMPHNSHQWVFGEFLELD